MMGHTPASRRVSDGTSTERLTDLLWVVYLFTGQTCEHSLQVTTETLVQQILRTTAVGWAGRYVRCPFTSRLLLPLFTQQMDVAL